MKTKKLFLTGLLLLTACGGGTSGSGSAGDPSITVSMDEGLSAMKASDLARTREVFCTLLEREPQNSRAAFGCALAESLYLPEAEPIRQLLAGVKEDPVDIQKSFFEEGGFWDILNASLNAGIKIKLKDFYGLNIPVIERIQNRKGELFVAGILTSALDTSLTGSIVQSLLKDWRPFYDSILSKLKIAKADAAFEFTIPKEFFSTDTDKVIRLADVKMYEAGLWGTLVAFKVIDAYDVSFATPEGLLQDSETLDLQAIADKANGSAGNRAGTLKNPSQTFAELHADLESFLASAVEALEELKNNKTSGLFKTGAAGADHEGFLQRSLITLNELKQSLGGTPVAMTYPSKTFPLKTVHLKGFIDSPPHSGDVAVQYGNPFVYQPEGNPYPWSRERIDLNTEFFKEFLKNVVVWQ